MKGEKEGGIRLREIERERREGGGGASKRTTTTTTTLFFSARFVRIIDDDDRNESDTKTHLLSLHSRICSLLNVIFVVVVVVVAWEAKGWEIEE